MTPMDSLSSFATFGEMLHYLRRQARLSQRELAIEVGYSESMISRLEHNERPPDAATIGEYHYYLLDEDDQRVLGQCDALIEPCLEQGEEQAAALLMFTVASLHDYSGSKAHLAWRCTS